MAIDNGKNRTTSEATIRSDDIRYIEGFSGIVGTVSTTSTRNGDDQIGTSRTDCIQENSPSTFTGESCAGGMFSQLIAETKEQIALYENCVVALKSRLEHLMEIAGAITTEVESE